MELLGSFLDEEWESLSQIFSSGVNHDFLLQHCHGNEEIPSPSIFPSHQANFFSVSQESSNTTEIEEALFLNLHGNEAHHHHNFNDDNSMKFLDFNDAGFMLPDDHHGVQMEDSKADSYQIKRKSDAMDAQMQDQDNAPQNPRKKPRLSRNAQKNKTVQWKKGKKIIQDKNNKNDDEEEELSGGVSKQSCSSYSSEEDSNASQELNEEIKNLKARASRGSATDPQSLYARKRRERINERLRILQNLVPNGTKVDISTMLEEAVQYVKFLQLQIKLLSSDNLWMYAPLAYNGMDIGMYQKICPNLRA